MVQASLIQSMQPSAVTAQTEAKSLRSPGEAQAGFANSLNDALHKLNELQVTSDKKTEALAKGEINNLHDVMVSAQKASVAMTTAVEVQKKALDAYNEMMRMQI